MTLNRTKFLAYMRERWIEPDSIMLAILENSPLLGMIPKDESLGGRFMRLPLIHTGAQGRSATYATAKTNAVGSDAVAFEVQYVNNFQIAKLEGDIVDDTRGDANALAEAIDTEMEATIANMKKDLNMGLFGNVGGARGRIGSVATGVAGANCRIVLLNKYDAKFFEKGVKIAVSANDGTAVGHALRAGTATITAVDVANGYLEFASDVTASITSPTANDYIFAEGDFKLKMSGLRGWIPTTDPTSGDSFHGVDRTAQVQRLSGLRQDISGFPLEDGIVHMCAVMGWADAHPDVCVMNPVRVGALIRSLGADRANRLTEVRGDDARVGYRAVSVAVPNGSGEIKVLADAGCNVDESLFLTTKTWKLGSVGKLVHVVDDDELMIRRGTGDDWAIDVKSRVNLGCKNPGLNGRGTLASL